MDEHREEREEQEREERDDALEHDAERRYWVESGGSDWLRNLADEMDAWAR